MRPKDWTLRRRSVAISILLLACVVLLCSCRREGSSPDVPPAASSRDGNDRPALDSKQPKSNPSTTTSIALERIGLVNEGLRADVRGTEWTVESFNAKATEQLKRIQAVLEGREVLEHSHLLEWVTDDIQCTQLTDPGLPAVFDADGIKVQRSDGAASTINFSGVAGFRNALTELIALLPNASHRRAAFKISHVTKNATSTAATIEFQLVGKSTEEVIQHSASWDCTWTTEDPPRLRSIASRDETRTTSDNPAMFADCAPSVLGQNSSYHEQLLHGVDHWLGVIEQRFGLNSAGWQGLAVGDVNGDGLDDLYVCQPGGLPNRLYVQQPDGTARDMSASAGVDWWDHSHAALFLDLDNDADQDLIVATTLGLIVMSNAGDGRFSVKTTKLCPEAMPFTMAAADYDQDGDLDVYASCYSPRGNAIATQLLGRPVPYHDANNGGRNCLFRNDGNWRFKNATKEAGLDQNNRRFSLAAAWEDYDNDGDQDLYVANDYGRNNLYRNDGGRFTDVAGTAGVEDISAGMSVSWGDYNRDGHIDLYVSNMWSSAGNRIAYQREFQTGATAKTKADFQRHARGNSLFMNKGDGTFRDVSVQADVTMGRWAWGSQFVDLNNDSRQDLFVVNGFITQDDTSDL